MIIFMGVAGSGKSLQGKMLADRLGLPWLSTGEFLRMLVAGERRIAMLSGQLLEDQEIITLIQKIFTIINTNEEFVLDGFPRTVSQADWLLNQVKHHQLSISAVIHLNATEAVVHERLLQRGRQDDHRDAIAERFKEFEHEIKPILDHFKSANITVCEINGEQDIQTIHDSIMRSLKDVQLGYVNKS
ncbi:MAG: adenylate kinase [Candidatus Saccharimonadales bacterium]